MSWWSRIVNVFRGEQVNRAIDEELESHIQEAIEHGLDPAAARQEFGSMLRHRESSRDVRLLTWLDSLRSDLIFAWRQLAKTKVTSGAAILSLALAIGACTSAFRLIDAILWRPLPVSHPERLYSLYRQGFGPDGKFRTGDGYEYPLFRQMRAAATNQAELIALSYADRTDLTYGSDQEMEKAHRQYVSGWMFETFGLRPAIGRLLSEADDQKPGAHPYAVLTYDYWTSRFGRDPNVIGRSFRMGNELYEVVGVVAEGFTGTEPGTVIDVFLPTMMHPAVGRSDSSWLRILACMRSDSDPGPLRDKLHSIFRAFQESRAKEFVGWPKQRLERFLDNKLMMQPAASGISTLQENYRTALRLLGMLVALVLLIACANVANLMTARAASRAREMALRVSLGSGRGRLVQLVLAEGALLAVLATIAGGVLAWWAAPFVVSMINPPDNPARLVLPADVRVLGFALALTLVVTCLFGLPPAWRASAVKPASALKGGEDPHSRRRLMHALIALQVTLCFLVHFAGGLFVTTFERLSNQPTGFSAERLLTLDTVTQQGQPLPAWNEVADRLREVPGVEKVSLTGWPLLSGTGWNGFVQVGDQPTGEVLAYFLNVTPGWLDTMKIPLIDGRDLRPDDLSAGTAIVNESFAKAFFNGQNPVGKSFRRPGSRDEFRIVGLVRDARYRNMREPMTATAYVPFLLEKADGTRAVFDRATFLVRTTAANPLSLASRMRREVSQAKPGFRVSNARTQLELNQSHTVRERLLALLAVFFSTVTLVLAAVGLYGVLDYSVLQRRREIGIYRAVGAPAGDVLRRVTVRAFLMVLLGAGAGLGIGLGSQRYLESLLYGVRATDPFMLAAPSILIFGIALLAAIPPAIRALRIDPVQMLRGD